MFLLPSGIMWHNTKHKKARIKTNYTSSGSLDVASGNYNFNLYNLQYPTYITWRDAGKYGNVEREK